MMFINITPHNFKEINECADLFFSFTALLSMFAHNLSRRNRRYQEVETDVAFKNKWAIQALAFFAILTSQH